MKKITEIYNEYKIMPNLQLHQMRVASVAWQICDSLSFDIDRESVVIACLLHDMGNIVKFDLNHFPAWNKPEGIEYWQKIKDEYLEKYGKNEHEATLIIGGELGISRYIYDLINYIDSPSVEINTAGKDFGEKICMYADNRVSPHGIVSAEEHSLDAKERYKNHPHVFDEEKRVSFMKDIYFIEEQIFSHSKIKPEDIDNESIKIYLEKLQDILI